MEKVTVLMPKISITCPFCGGDGINRCSNPDHGFIDAVGGEIGRLGCPVCGHDEKHRIKNRKSANGWETCEHCKGCGLVHEFTDEVIERLAEL